MLLRPYAEASFMGRVGTAPLSHPASGRRLGRSSGLGTLDDDARPGQPAPGSLLQRNPRSLTV